MPDLEVLKQMQEKINKAKVDIAVNTNELNKLEEELTKLCDGADPEKTRNDLLRQIEEDEKKFKEGMSILTNELPL